MLKNFMHPGNVKTDSNRTSPTAGHSTHEPAKRAEPVKPVESPRAEAYPGRTNNAPSEDGNKLIVGPNIKLKGSEITDCEILVVEGRVEASMNSRDIRIAEGGVFSGKAEIDVAEVHGTFEGDLTARKRLVIYATGRVSGVIRYGALMVEEGGSISGEVATLSAGARLTKVPETPAQTAEPVQEKTTEREQIQFGSTLARNQAGKRQG
ncbi:MAG TPA: polymer-forming cytoskeletal protein [Thiobacillus sp.]|jgi:cytoskeletal protein CcmA (bactofilin family)|nr:polymer-forming cytoskeletal protein [Thiobacillus sp.]